jgi:hypothetical protein
MQHLFHPVIELVCSAASSHDAQLLRRRAIELGLCLLEFLNEVNAQIDSVCLEVEEVEPPTAMY